jgi:hypothetical protein
LLICILAITYDYLTTNQINPDLWYIHELDQLLSHALWESILCPSIRGEDEPGKTSNLHMINEIPTKFQSENRKGIIGRPNYK